MSSQHRKHGPSQDKGTTMWLSITSSEESEVGFLGTARSKSFQTERPENRCCPAPAPHTTRNSFLENRVHLRPEPGPSLLKGEPPRAGRAKRTRAELPPKLPGQAVISWFESQRKPAVLLRNSRYNHKGRTEGGRRLGSALFDGETFVRSLDPPRRPGVHGSLIEQK